MSRALHSLLCARTAARTVVAAASVLLAACGSDDSDRGSTDDTGSRSAGQNALAESDLWLSFDETQVTEAGESGFADADGGDPVGRVVRANEGVIEMVGGADGSGSALQFPPICTEPVGCPRVMVEIGSDPALEPGERTFVFGAAVWLAPDQTTSGSNIVQKGRFATVGGLWKLQVDSEDGEPSCVLRSGDTLLRVRSSVSIADSSWHRVQCTRDTQGIGIAVDGVEDRVPGKLGSVDNEWPIRIGSPGVGDEDDQFHGRIDDVFLSIAPLS